MRTEENENLKVSILIPLYNQERYFKACIKSVEKQTYKNLEIIIVNDGSTDRSPQMARDWAARDNRVKVIDKNNEGTGFARRDGYLAATGELITFLDSDDVLPSRAIDIMVTCVLENNVDLVIGSYDHQVGFFISNHKDKAYTFPVNQIVCQPKLFEEFYESFFRIGSFFPEMACAKMYRKSIIDQAYQETELFSPEIRVMGEDAFFNMKVFPYLRSMFRTYETVYLYRYGGTTFGYNKNFPQVLILLDKQLELLDKYNYRNGYKPLFDKYMSLLLNYAAQLIHFKKSEKEEILNVFRMELANRKMVPRIEEYYAGRCDSSKNISLLLTRDLDGLYDQAFKISEMSYGTLRFKIVKSLVDFLSRF